MRLPPARALLLCLLPLSACGDSTEDTQATDAASDSDSVDATAGPSETGASETGSSDATTAGSDSDGSETDATTEEPQAIPTDEGLRVAFFGDNGLGDDSLATLELVASEGADFLIILGDFDYLSLPAFWEMQLTEGLGEGFPLFAAVGNHDVDAWPEYQANLEARYAAISGAACDGDLGVQSSCLYRGLHFLLSGVGTLGSGHESWIADELAASDAIWKVCAWHKNQNDMQAGGKGDEVGWGAYKACQDGGAIVATGHEHSYSRTQSLTDLGNVAGGHGATGEHESLMIRPGETFVFVSGMGGTGIRDYHADEHDDDTWWSTIYTEDHYRKHGQLISDFSAEVGVTFIDFYVDGDPYKARGYFKNVDGLIIDEWEMHAAP
ncbi:MAG: metallophosphoesterase [Nannocystaceae bacterium]|nr:metallophosphoesterase [Myxococcales bacterium]